MNQVRRELLEKARILLQTAEGFASAVLFEEENAAENIPENLQGSQRYEEMQEAVEAIEEAIDCIGEADQLLGGIT